MPPEILRPDASEYATFYTRYIRSVPDGDLLSHLRDNGRELERVLRPLSEERAAFRYAEGKWSIRDIVGHLIDAERIFAYRALRMARGDTAPLAGFDENAYAAASNADARRLADLLEELRSVREASVLLFASFPADAWLRTGTASGQPVSVRALAYITLGHAMHHLQVLRERYGVVAAA